MDSERKAFRLVGGVLAQNTVGDVLPAVTQHAQMVIMHAFQHLCSRSIVVFIHLAFRQLKQLMGSVEGQLKAKEEQAQAWKVRVVFRGGTFVDVAVS